MATQLRKQQLQNPYKARAYQSSVQSIANASIVKVQFNAESFDPNGDFDSTTGYDYTAPVTGYYQVNTRVVFNLPATAVWTVGLVHVNGVSYARGESVYTGKYESSATNCIVYATAGQTIDYRIYQNSGAARNLTAGSSESYFDIHLISL